MKKRMMKTGLGLVCILFVMVLSLYLYATTDHAKNLILHKINRAIPGTLAVDDIEFSFTGSYVRLNGIQIQDSDNTTCFKAKALFVDFSAGALLNKTLELTVFTVESPEISLAMDKSGVINLVDAFTPKERVVSETQANQKESLDIPFNVTVKKAQIMGGVLTFSDPDNHIELGAFDIDMVDADLFAQTLSVTSRFKNSTIRLKDRQIRLENLSLSSQLEPGSKIGFDIALDTDLGSVTAKGAAWDIINSPQMDLKITAASLLERLNPFLNGAADLGGSATLALTAKGTLNNPDIELDLDVSPFRVDANLKGNRIALSARLDDRIVTITKAHLDMFGSDMALDGRADLNPFFPQGLSGPVTNSGTIPYEFSFEQKKGDFQYLDNWVKGVSGRFSSSGSVTGRGFRPEEMAVSYQLNLAVHEFKQDRSGADFLDLETDLTGTFENGLCKITGLNARTGDAAITGSGQYDIFNNTVNAAVNIAVRKLDSLLKPLGIPDVKGSLDSKIKVAGHTRNPDITAQVFGKNLMAQGIFVNDLQFQGALKPDGLVQVQKLVVNSQDQVLDLKGSARVFETLLKPKSVISADIMLSGRNINPARFLEQAGIQIEKAPLDAVINTDLNILVDYGIGASMGKPNFQDIQIPVKKIRAGLDFEKRQIDITLENAASLNATLDTQNSQYKARINFDHSDLSPFLQSAGIEGIKARFDGHIDAAGNVPGNLMAQLSTELDAAKGSITLSADVNGSFREPDYTVAVDLAHLDYHSDRSGITISNLNGNVAATPDRITIHGLTAGYNDGHFSLTGSVGLKAYQIQDVSLALLAEQINIPIPAKTGEPQKIRVEKVESDLDVHLQHDETALNMTEEASENRFPINHIRTAINLTTLDFSALVDKTTDLKASFDPDNSAYDLTVQFNGTVLDRVFKMAGLDGITAQVDGHVKSKGKIFPGLPQDVIDGFRQATGELTGLINIKGDFEKPDFDADITLSKLGYPIPQAGITISNLNGNIQVAADSIQIQNLTADLDKGSLSMDGKIDLEAYAPVKGEIRFKGKNIILEMPDMALIEFNHDLNFSGTPDKSTLSGKFKMLKGRYYKDFTIDLADMLEAKKRRTAPQAGKAGEPNSWLENMALNIDVDYKEPFAVDNNIAFILIEPDVTVTGTAVNPIVTGRARVIEGTIVYLKKEFEIEKGIIDFTDPYKIDPVIDVAAKTSVRKWTIFLEISGKTDNLKFNLFSKPEETHKDILSLLIAGKTTREMGKSTKGSYTNILTDKAADIIGKNVEESTPLDSFKVGYDDAEGSNVSVTVGKKLSKRLEVLYTMESQEDETVHTRAAEYKILENILLKAFNDSNGMIGTEITFKLEFR